MVWTPITCEHGGDAGLTRELLSRCPICRRDQCGQPDPVGVPRGRGRRQVVTRCSKRRGHSTPHTWEESRPARDRGQGVTVTPRVRARSSAPAATLAPQDLAAGESTLWEGE